MVAAASTHGGAAAQASGASRSGGSAGHVAAKAAAQYQRAKAGEEGHTLRVPCAA